MTTVPTKTLSDDPLPPDELGEAAEALFKNLCARTRLTCNKSDRDRSGWDFVVDFPMAADSGATLLDQRQKQRCNVQLKATAAVGSGTVSLKLSAAELLAKEPQPAFIIVFRMRRDGEAVKGYLIHLLAAPLAKILRRLREAEARGRRDTHNLKISFDYRRLGRPFALTPEGLRAALEEGCGGDPAAYVREKLHQLEILGYEQGHLAGNAWFQVESDDQLSRILLGNGAASPGAFRSVRHPLRHPDPLRERPQRGCRGDHAAAAKRGCLHHRDHRTAARAGGDVRRGNVLRATL